MRKQAICGLLGLLVLLVAMAAIPVAEAVITNVTLSAPADNQATNNCTRLFNYTVNINGTNLNVTKATLVTDWSGAWIANNTNASAVSTGSVQSITVQCVPDTRIQGRIWTINISTTNDSSTIWAETNRTIFIDNTNPVVTVLTPASSTAFTNTPVGLSVQVTDLHTIDNITYNINGGGNTNTTICSSRCTDATAFVGVNTGLSYITVYVTDNFTNVGTGNITGLSYAISSGGGGSFVIGEGGEVVEPGEPTVAPPMGPLDYVFGPVFAFFDWIFNIFGL